MKVLSSSSYILLLVYWLERIYFYVFIFSRVFHLLQSLSGHSSGIDSVNFDSSEVLVAAGAASGTIKLWDLEEAKSKLLLAI